MIHFFRIKCQEGIYYNNAQRTHSSLITLLVLYVARVLKLD